MSHPNKGGLPDDWIKYPPEPSDRPRPRQVWTAEGGGVGSEQFYRTHSYGNSSVPGEAVEAHSVNANGVLLAGHGQYGMSPATDSQMFPLLAKKFEEAVDKNEELQRDIDHLKKSCTDYIGEADKAVKDMKARHRAQLSKKDTRVREMQKLYEDTLKQYEDAKIVVLSYKSKNIELEGHNRGLIAQLEESQKRGATGSPRELERLRRNVEELRRDNQACMAALQMKDEDLKEMCEKRDQFKKSYHQAANERDSLAAQVAQLQRKLTELDSSSTKKEASALRMRLQESQVSNVGLQDQLRDLQQQLQSANTGSLLQQQEAQGMAAELQQRHERDLLAEREQVSQWKGRWQQAEDRARSIEGELETLKSENSDLLTTIRGLKRTLDLKEDDIRGLQAEKSRLQDVTSPSGRESDWLASQLAEKKCAVEELTAQLAAKTSDLQLAEEKQRTAEDWAKHLQLEKDQLGEKELGLKAQLRLKESTLKSAEAKITELKQQSQDTGGRAELHSPTSPRSPLPAGAPKPTQNRQIVQLLKQLDEKVEKEKDLEQECAQLRQRIVEIVSELESSKENTKRLEETLQSREGDLRDREAHYLAKDEELQSVKEKLGFECESLQRLQLNYQQDKEQLEARAEQYEGRYKEYRQELKQHAQALKQVSQELQGERFSRNKLQGELDQCRQELQALEKCRRDLKDEQGTSHLLREQLKQYVSDFQMEKQGHQRTVQDKLALDQRVRDLEKENRQLKQAYDSRQAQPLGHLYKVESQDEPARGGIGGGKHDQFTEYARVAPPMYPTANRPSSAAQVPKATGIQPPGGGTRPAPTGASQLGPLPHGGGAQEPKGTLSEDPAARRHPCPICGRTFPDLQKLERHASNCNGN